MSTPQHAPARRVPPFARLSLILLASCCLDASEVEPAATPPKTHRLFMGSNLTIVSKDASLPVKDVRNNSFVVKGAKGDLVISPQTKEFQIKIDDALKLSPASDLVAIDKLIFDRVYTHGNDPMRKFEDAARVSAYMADSRDAADSAYRQADRAVSLADTVKGEGSAEIKIFAAAQMAAAQSTSERAQTIAMTDAYSTVTISSRMASDIAAEAFDALKVTFTVSSQKPLTTPYVVIFMRFFEQKDLPETATVWVYAEKLPDIDAAPRKIAITRGGFPPGYHIDSHHVHLYDGTSELATSVSRKQMELTEDEAFQYSIIQHISANRDNTLPPARAGFFWPKDLRSRLSPAQLTRTFFVKVGKNGRITGIFEDKGCNRPVSDKELVALSPDLRFLPALEKGKPIESVAAVKLAADD